MKSLAKLWNGDCIKLLKTIPDNSIDVVISDIPYGIDFSSWDVLHENKNSALLGQSPAQIKEGTIFKSRGKPKNGWSEADKQRPIPDIPIPCTVLGDGCHIAHNAG